MYTYVCVFVYILHDTSVDLKIPLLVSFSFSLLLFAFQRVGSGKDCVLQYTMNIVNYTNPWSRVL